MFDPELSQLQIFFTFNNADTASTFCKNPTFKNKCNTVFEQTIFTGLWFQNV